MEIKPIKNDAEYRTALRKIERLFNAPEGTSAADKLEILVLLVQNYEAKHYPMPIPDPIDFLRYAMENRGLTRKDLEPYIGSRGRVAEVLNRARPLSLLMIRRLASGLKLPAEVLIQDYALGKAA